MLSRRSFAKLLGAGAVAGAIKVSAAQVRPKIVHQRPPITGVPRYTYLEASMPQCDQFSAAHGNKRLYLDGRDVTMVAFEVDLVGQWVGLFDHHVNTDGRLQIDSPPPGNTWAKYDANGREVSPPWELGRYWQFGRVEIRIASCSIPRPIPSLP